MYCFGNKFKSYCAVLLTAFYISLQAFVLLVGEGPAAPNLRDVQSVYMMQAIKSIKDDATVTQRAAFAMFIAAFSSAPQPKPLTEAFSEGLGAFFVRMPAWAVWDDSIGAAQEARASADMVARK